MKSTGKEAFRRGLLTGFSSPYQFMYGGRARVFRSHRDFVSLSWEEVGNAVRDAIDSERESVGKAPKSCTRTGRRNN